MKNSKHNPIEQLDARLWKMAFNTYGPCKVLAEGAMGALACDNWPMVWAAIAKLNPARNLPEGAQLWALVEKAHAHRILVLRKEAVAHNVLANLAGERVRAAEMLFEEKTQG